jgi:hypothetical protein
MTLAPADLWPWATLAAIGAFHGLNPAMGWLFAVALGLHRGSRRALFLSLGPIALGHALAAALAVAAVLSIGASLDQTVLRRLMGIVLVAWAIWHALYGHRRRVRIGMQTGLSGLALWSFLMAGAHGAGLMLVPVMLPLCAPGAPGATAIPGDVVVPALTGLGVHTLAMLAVIASVAILVYQWVGLAFLRRGWINFDALWTAALGGSGVFLALTPP